MDRMKIICVVGARPNFVKIAPLMRELEKHADRAETLLVHTGQHYDKALSDSLFEDLNIRAPDYNLGVGSGTHSEQTSKIMLAFEKVCVDEKPDLIIVVGDVNSTIACALVGKKMGIKVAHVEAGLRSFDESMPEEINRVLTDRVSDFLFVSEKSGLENLRNEGVENGRIFFVGNIMIDTLVGNLGRKTGICEKLGLKPKGYCVVTLHRPSNVDRKEDLRKVIGILDSLKIDVVWPIHPRAKKNIYGFGLGEEVKRFKIIEPQGYLDFMTLVSGAKFILTDSGGIQEETAYLGIPCLTLRPNTERPSTIEAGTNVLVGTLDEVSRRIKSIEEGKLAWKGPPELWDGKTAERIVKIILDSHKKLINAPESQ